MSYFKLEAPTQVQGPVILTICPNCGRDGTFDKIITDVATKNFFFGLRRCPNPECLSSLFYIKSRPENGVQLFTTYPAAKISFNRIGIPDRVLRSFDEAVACHSSDCYIASAIMIRKTLEEICSNKGAKGANLFKRLESLAKIIVVPNELIEATQDLRLLGNDAAHLEAQTYEEIGKEEIEISIEFTQEIIKAVYQYQDLLGKLRGLKK